MKNLKNLKNPKNPKNPKNLKNFKLSKGLKIILAIIVVLALVFIIKGAVVIISAYFMDKAPYENASGIDNYNKTDIVEEHGSDLDSEMLIFPDDTDNMIKPTFEAKLKKGFFDTKGYIILQARYNEQDYEKEVDRISKVECEVSDIVLGVRYDDKSYCLPAYVAIDGKSNVYEYALMDDRKCEITYLLLSYPESEELDEYKDYLKLDESEYKGEDTWDKFSIYSRHFEDGEYIEYSDEKS
ncbi:MAG: hypothetical protein IJD02_04180 [Lachnospiraceae bacterium]|nr:hypothetical protein [Lachnospiraceae bacterium]